MKILILNPYQGTRWNPGHQHFRDAISDFHDCMYYGPGFLMFKNNNNQNDIGSILKYLKKIYQWKPELILTYGYRYTAPFSGLGEVKIPKAHIICDFTPPAPGWSGTIPYYLPMLKSHNYDIYFAMSYQVMNWFSAYWPSANIHYLPFGVDQTIFRPMNLKDKYDLYIGWSNHDAIYPLRRPLEKHAKDEVKNGMRVLIERRYHENFVKAINESIVNLNTSNIFRTMNMKNFEVMACRRVLLTEQVRELDGLGYKPMVHYVDYTSPEDAMEKVKTLLEHPSVADSIAQYGYEKTIMENTNNQRVVEMTRRLNGL